MAELVFKELGSSFSGGNEIWFRSNLAGELTTAEFFGAPAGGTEGYVKVWLGSSWELKPVKVWTGSAWVIKPVKFWNGSTWVLA